MVQRIRKFQAKHPFLFIMAIGLIVRIIAAIFSRGFGMHDDHFLVIEQAQSWVDGGDYLNWLPGSPGNNGPEGHSFFYVGIHYLLLHFFQFLGIDDPQIKMFFIRLIHTAISLMVISFGYRIASLITARETAYKVAMLLALSWYMPFLSVRNMVEMVSIPFLMYGTLIVLRQELIRKADEPGYHQTSFLVAGFFLGLAFSVRYQTLIYTGGLGLALLFSGNRKGMISTALGFLTSVFIFQGIIDFLVWNRPFAEFIEYVNYNLNHAYEYHTAPWYNYLLVLGGLLIPPVSIMLLFGFARNWKKNFLLFLPVILFILFHSSFPNKQERFILPIVPMLIVLGLAGWKEYEQQSSFWKQHPKVITVFWLIFWVLNTGLLVLVTPTYSKKARVESMVYLQHYPETKYFVVDDYDSHVLRFPPVFYSNQWPTYDAVINHASYRELASQKAWNDVQNQPDFVLFHQEKNLKTRIDSMLVYLPGLEYEATFKPGFMDRLIHRINPINANETITLYRNSAVVPKKKQ